MQTLQVIVSNFFPSFLRSTSRSSAFYLPSPFSLPPIQYNVSFTSLPENLQLAPFHFVSRIHVTSALLLCKTDIDHLT